MECRLCRTTSGCVVYPLINKSLRIVHNCVHGALSDCTTEYTQSGNCRFMVYFPSWWKNQPWMVREGVHAHPLTHLLPSRTKLQCTLQLRRQIHSPYFISTPLCTLWTVPCKCTRTVYVCTFSAIVLWYRYCYFKSQVQRDSGGSYCGTYLKWVFCVAFKGIIISFVQIEFKLIFSKQIWYLYFRTQGESYKAYRSLQHFEHAFWCLSNYLQKPTVSGVRYFFKLKSWIKIFIDINKALYALKLLILFLFLVPCHSSSTT
jgi:hypothetical protein